MLAKKTYAQQGNQSQLEIISLFTKLMKHSTYHQT